MCLCTVACLQFFGGGMGGGMGGDPFAGLFGGGMGGGPFGGMGGMGGMPGGMPGGMGGGPFGGPMGGHSGGPPKDKPITKHLGCTLEELFAGSTRKLKITRTIFGAGGKASRTDEQVLEVNVKPGWKKGTKVTFPEKGGWVCGGRTGSGGGKQWGMGSGRQGGVGRRGRVQAMVKREWWECRGAVVPPAMVCMSGSSAATSACRSLCGLLTGSSRPLLLWLLTLLRR